MELEPWLLNWTAFLARNTHAEIKGIGYDDGPEWFELMWESWLNNSDYGIKLKENFENNNNQCNHCLAMSKLHEALKGQTDSDKRR